MGDLHTCDDHRGSHQPEDPFVGKRHEDESQGHEVSCRERCHSETGAVKEKVEVSTIGIEEKVEEKSAFLLWFLYTTLSSETVAVNVLVHGIGVQDRSI